MLSYLKDGNQSPVISELQEETQAETNDPQTYMTVSGQGKKVRQSTIALGILFVVAGAAVWFMAQKSTPASVDAAPSQDQAQLEAALAQLDSMQDEMDSQMDSVAGRFSQFNSVEQVAVDELKKNPFKRELDYTVDGGDAKLDQQQEMARQEAQVLAMGLQLWSITATPKGVCCMIDDKVLYVGDSYKNMTVTAIEDKVVKLEYKGFPVELKMD